MRKDTEYTFVTIDHDMEDMQNNAVIIDIDHDGDLLAAVSIDNDAMEGDFITLADDTIMLSDPDMTDIISSDIIIDDTDISMML
jgi:hypothetical protein